jgi:hypothetical protein
MDHNRQMEAGMDENDINAEFKAPLGSGARDLGQVL